MAGFSPEMAGGGGVEKMVRHGGVPRQWQSSGGRGTGGGDRLGEARSKRGGRRGHGGAHQRGEKWWHGDAKMACRLGFPQ
jgi:hypothetical protein